MKFKLKAGVKTVATAGTRVALASGNIWARALKITAPSTNTGAVYIGESDVDPTHGFLLPPGASINFSDSGLDIPAVNLSSVYADAATNGDQVTFAYLEEVQ